MGCHGEYLQKKSILEHLFSNHSAEELRRWAINPDHAREYLDNLTMQKSFADFCKPIDLQGQSENINIIDNQRMSRVSQSPSKSANRGRRGRPSKKSFLQINDNQIMNGSQDDV